MNAAVMAPPAAAILSPAETTAPIPDISVYGLGFWLAYGANCSLVIANSLLARYVEFVRLHEPNSPEWFLGWIVGVGMVGSVLMRMIQGTGMDRYGPRLVWLLSASGFVLSCLGHLWISSMNHPGVFLLRVLMSCSLAGVFGASMVVVSRRTSPARMAEVIGALGTSGFLGMLCGPAIGDLIFHTQHTQAWQIQTMFLIAALLGVASFTFAVFATGGEEGRPARQRHLPVLGILRKYRPGVMLPMGMVMGIGLTVPLIFLADFSRHLGIRSIGSFFAVYAISAFITRVSIRRFSENYGIRLMVVIGMVTLILGYVGLLLAKNMWQLGVAGVVLGICHAFIFPAVIAGGTSVFPPRHRGVGTSLMLLSFDLGTLFGGPLVSGILVTAKLWHWPPYPTVFAILATLYTLALVYYVVATRPSSASVVRGPAGTC